MTGCVFLVHNILIISQYDGKQLYNIWHFPEIQLADFFFPFLVRQHKGVIGYPLSKKCPFSDESERDENGSIMITYWTRAIGAERKGADGALN